MVPFGVSNPSTPPLMLMEGTIVHTNELMVLLGDNWFVERSAKESIDIINRRQTKIKTLIEKFNAEKAQHEIWLGMINSLYGKEGGFQEINEKCDEDEEKRWREVHRQKVREHKRREAEERAKMNISHEEMMKRLDKFELAESEPLKSSLKSSNQGTSSKSVKFHEPVENLKYGDDEGELEKDYGDNREEEKYQVFSGEVVERCGGYEDGRVGGEVNEREKNAPLRDPSHKDEPVPQPKKVSQFKLARQSRQ